MHRGLLADLNNPERDKAGHSPTIAITNVAEVMSAVAFIMVKVGLLEVSGRRLRLEVKSREEDGPADVKLLPSWTSLALYVTFKRTMGSNAASTFGTILAAMKAALVAAKSAAAKAEVATAAAKRALVKSMGADDSNVDITLAL